MRSTEDLMEHMLAVALCADSLSTTTGHQVGGYTLPNWVDGGMKTRNGELPICRPRAAYAQCSELTGQRLVTTTHELLLAHPADVIGTGCEVMTLYGDHCRWVRLEPVDRLPRGLAVAGRAHYWSAMHLRDMTMNGMQSYYSTLVPFSKSGQPLAAKWGDAWVSKPANIGRLAIATCSMVEDSRRPNVMLASVRDGVELIFPVAEDAYLEAFALRDAPVTPQGRRRALLHWVAKHMRITRRGYTKVRRHMRGVTEFEIGGYWVKLWTSDPDAGA